MSPETRLHEQITELLPWYVNETLEDDERRRVETHLATCETCHHEVEILREVGRALQAETPTPKAELYTRTVARLQPQGMGRFFDSLRQLVAPIPTYAQVAIAAQLVVIAVLLGTLISAGPFTTLSDRPGRVGPAAVVQVMFAEKATATQIQEVLAPLKARIVDGPSSMGLYTVEVPVGPEGTVMTGDQALQRIRAKPFIEFAEIVEERQ